MDGRVDGWISTNDNNILQCTVQLNDYNWSKWSGGSYLNKASTT